AQSSTAAMTESSGSDQGTIGADSKGKEPHRFEWLVANADVGYRALDLRKIEYEDKEGSRGRVIPAAAGGLSPGLGVGVRLWFVSLMLHGDVTFLSDDSGVLDDGLELWNLDIESAWRLMQGRFQPYLLLGIGYSALGGISDVIDNARAAADAQGANARLGLGFDYYFHRYMTLGFRAHADGLLLTSRTSVADLTTPEKVDTLGETKERLQEADGSIMGLCYAAGLTFGVRYP
ncbi:MAG TPA: hypothetical protein VK509_08520, partial [Polyangiales bacterium]|nr:hypothetical protein [Polyangiales bacterium]